MVDTRIEHVPVREGSAESDKVLLTGAKIDVGLLIPVRGSGRSWMRTLLSGNSSDDAIKSAKLASLSRKTSL